ncbi:MAG: shikimate kinase [Spirochaetia bacterium]
MKPDRIILIGFMGSGKTTVGRILAARLGWDLVDTDELVEARAGAPVARLFQDLGERAFRDREAEALASLRQRTRLVVATGGGAPAQPRNRDFFSGPAAVFHLRVSLQTVRERTRENAGRPLLALSESALRALYESRMPVYDSMGTAVETEGRKPEEVAENILLLFRTQESQAENED